MDCKKCNEKLLENSIFCPSCGVDNSEGAENSFEILSFLKNNAIFLGVVLVVNFLVCFNIWYRIQPPNPIAELKSGIYDDFINVSFYIKKDGDFDLKIKNNNSSSFQDYNGQEFFLNNSDNYTYSLYSENIYGKKSKTVEFEYTIELPIPSDIFPNLESGFFTEVQSLTLSNGGDSEIYYTTDGTIPSKNSRTYSQPIELNDGITTIKSVAINDHNVSSEYFEWVYEVQLPRPGVVTLPKPNQVYIDSVTIPIQGNENETIYYTLDGTIPTTNSVVYTEPLVLTRGINKLNVITVHNVSGYQSQVFSETYCVNYDYVNDDFNFTSIAAMTDVGYFTRYLAKISKYNDDITSVNSINDDMFPAKFKSTGRYFYYVTNENILYCYDTHTSSYEELEVGTSVGDFEIINGVMYIISDNQIYSLCLETGDRTTIYESEDLHDNRSYSYFRVIDGELKACIQYASRDPDNPTHRYLNENKYFALNNNGEFLEINHSDFFYRNYNDLKKYDDDGNVIEEILTLPETVYTETVTTGNKTIKVKEEYYISSQFFYGNKYVFCISNDIQEDDGETTFYGGYIYTWYVYDMDTGELKELDIPDAERSVQIVDDYLIANGKRINIFE